MPWSGGNYTKWNGAGGWTADAAANIGIEAGRHDDQDVDFQNGIDACLNKNGQNSMANDLNLGGNKITNLDVGVASTDAVTLGQAQAGINIANTNTIWSVSRYSADSTGPQIALQKSRGASVGVNTAVVNNDVLGIVKFNANDGTNFITGADIVAELDGVRTTDMPTRLRFRTVPAGSTTLVERMRITDDGLVGINTTPTYQLDVVRNVNSSDPTLRINNSSTGSSAFSKISFTNNTGGIGTYIGLAGGNTTSAPGGASSLNLVSPADPIACRVGGSGGVVLFATGTSWSVLSDARYKTNIQALEYGLNELLQLNPIRFDYVDDESTNSERMGFIAQDVQVVMPEVVKGSLETKLSISPTELIPALVNAIKQLEARVAALEA